jgi:hypothetical protein
MLLSFAPVSESGVISGEGEERTWFCQIRNAGIGIFLRSRRIRHDELWGRLRIDPIFETFCGLTVVRSALSKIVRAQAMCYCELFGASPKITSRK